MTAQDRLKQYIEEDEIYNNYLTRKMNMSDFDKFCVQHCKDIEEILNEVQKLKEVIDKAIEFLKGFHNYEKRFKWCEQDYIDTIEELERILKEVE